MPPSAAADLELMRASLLLETDPAAAARQASAVLADSPTHTEARLLLATALRKLGNPAAAVAALEALAHARPDSALLQLELGRAYAAHGARAAALDALRRAAALDARLADAWRELAEQLFAAGETLEGDRAYQRYLPMLRQAPELDEAARELAANRLEVAEAILRRRLQQAPQDVVALRMLADAAARREDTPEVERCLTACLALAPGYAGARFDLARLLLDQQRIGEMLPHVDRLLAADAGNIDCLSLKATALRLVGRSAEAIALMEQAVTARPDQDQAWLLYGHLLREIGEQARAIEIYRRVLALRPDCGRAYASLANLQTFRFTAAERTAMQQQLEHGVRDEADRIALEFALGKALEDSAEYADSFIHYARGNALHRKTLYYDPNVVSAQTQLSRALLSARFFAERANWGSEQTDPIFIVGLPRSGSTLLEQMLASHSQIEGTHELSEVAALAYGLWSRGEALERPPYPQPLAGLQREEAQTFAARYLASTRAYRASGKPRFVDKMLGNFDHMGLIQLMFPRAAIIDARRHPLACGFSCFKQHFNRGQKFTYDLNELGRYYRDYVEVMEHYDTVLPGRVHRVYYEKLIADPERELRQLLEYCGLPFEAQCLKFYENPRVVHTLSSEQVRQPLYAESIDRWRNYEPWLGPLREALGDVLERYPAQRPVAA